MRMLLLENICALLTPVGNEPARGAAQGEIRELRDVSILLDGERIAAIAENGRRIDAPDDTERFDAGGALCTPGLIDAHTHLVFGGWRHHEVPLKLKGAGYLDILQAGGGILDTVRHTRAASEQALYARASGFLDEQLRLGVTTTEIKSGYGIDLETEKKQLRVICRLGRERDGSVVSTYLGAHAIPPEYENADAYTDDICKRILPQIAREGLARYCDVFCETGVFTVGQARRILTCAKALGLGLKIHADEIDRLGGSCLAGELSATSAEHLIASSETDMDAMAGGGVIACLLPMTSCYLNKPYAHAREMIARNVAVAVASDFNPGSCPSLNLQLAINLAYLKYRMTPAEILTAVTLNAACAVGLGETRGTAEVGKRADLTLWNADGMEMICYRMGSNQVSGVFRAGKRVV